MAENRYQRAGALPDIRLGEPPRCDWLQNIRNAAPLLILLLTSCVCTFLVPALVSTGSARSSSGLVEVPQAQRTTTSLLDRLPITSSTSSTSSTSTLTLTLTSTLPQRPLTTGSTSSVSPASLPITIDLDVEMQVRGVDQNLLSNKPFLRQAFATSIHTTIARTIGVPPSSVVLHLPSGSSLTVRARVTPPDGETAGDLYAQVRDSRRALGAAVAKAISDTENIRSVVRGTIGVGGVEVWMVPSNEVEDNVDVVADVSKTYTATATATATTTTTTLAANLAEAATMVTRTDGDIPAFNGAAKGSLVAASGMAGAMSDSTIASFAAGGGLGADLFLSSSNVVYNNLGGLGPGKGEPPELRYGGVCNVGGKPLDLSITVGGEHEYQPKLPTLNGMGSHKASVASINLALGSSVDLQMRFLRRDGLEQKAVRLHRVFVSIFDVDEPFRAISAPDEVFMSGFQAVLWPNGTSFVPPVGGVDAWAAPDGVAAVYVFTDVDAVRLRLRAVQNVGNALGNYAGRTFLISLNSPDAEPVHGAVHAKSLLASNGAAAAGPQNVVFDPELLSTTGQIASVDHNPSVVNRVPPDPGTKMVDVSTSPLDESGPFHVPNQDEWQRPADDSVPLEPSSGKPPAVQLVLRVAHVDYSKLEDDIVVMRSFKTVLRSGIAAAAGPGVKADALHVRLSGTPLLVEATISLPVADGTVLQRIQRETSLPWVLSSMLQWIDGIGRVSDGHIEVAILGGSQTRGSIISHVSDALPRPTKTVLGSQSLQQRASTSRTTTITQAGKTEAIPIASTSSATTAAITTSLITRILTTTNTATTTSVTASITTSKTTTSVTQTLSSTTSSSSTTTVSRTLTLTLTTTVTTQTSTETSTTQTTTQTSTSTSSVLAAVASRNQKVGLTLRLRNLDYSQLLSGPPRLLSVFVAGVRQVIVEAAGHGVRAADVDISLSPGSVIVHATIRASLADSALVLSSLKSSDLLVSEMMTTVGRIKGIGKVIIGHAGPVEVGEVNVFAVAASSEVIIPHRFWGLLLILAFCCAIPLLANLLHRVWGATDAETLLIRHNMVRRDAWYRPVMSSGDEESRQRVSQPGRGVTPGGGFEDAFSSGALIQPQNTSHFGHDDSERGFYDSPHLLEEAGFAYSNDLPRPRDLDWVGESRVQPLRPTRAASRPVSATTDLLGMRSSQRPAPLGDWEGLGLGSVPRLISVPQLQPLRLPEGEEELPYPGHDGHLLWSRPPSISSATHPWGEPSMPGTPASTTGLLEGLGSRSFPGNLISLRHDNSHEYLQGVPPVVRARVLPSPGALSVTDSSSHSRGFTGTGAVVGRMLSSESDIGSDYRWS